MAERRAVVVEDDPSIAELVSEVLGRAGFAVTRVADGSQALAVIAETNPDLVTLDLSLPGMDGVEVCRRIRDTSDCYVVMLTARAQEIDVLIGLEVGADDYIAKPFSPRELTARVAALFRRPRGAPDQTRAASPASPAVIDGGAGLLVDRNAHLVTIDGDVVDLTRTEYDLLCHLATRSGTVVPRGELLREVWDTEFTGDSHVVDVHVANLRRKLRLHSTTSWIRTVRGVGFRFDGA
ncbi:DNA-binding response regulator [Nocardioides gansuensis]|uniref:DNA-binding response regulator n=1 Tax=Nocardioides gansuensis TaxID=2138300 RepID=A0A2T8FEU6_9ACTN|nr:response regulator transcription factor [Nocardioides gansuensis]PVG84219.1 DNA-binding response regulator [Nocardioides gansuensis]